MKQVFLDSEIKFQKMIRNFGFNAHENLCYD